jgi:myxalamid-type polyketide synthase MxaB
MRSRQQLTGAEFYADLEQRFQTSLGPSWQWITAVWQGEGEALGRIQAPADIISGPQDYSLHPGLLGALLYLASATTGEQASESSSQPVAIEKVCLYRRPADNETLWAYARQVAGQQWEMQLLDQTGEVLAEVIGLEGVEVTRAQLLGQPSWQDWLYGLAWPVQPLALPGNLPTPPGIFAQLAPCHRRNSVKHGRRKPLPSGKAAGWSLPTPTAWVNGWPAVSASRAASRH